MAEAEGRRSPALASAAACGAALAVGAALLTLSGSGGPAGGAPGIGPATGPGGGTDPSPGFDVLEYDLRLSLREGSERITGRQAVTFLSTRAALPRVELDLAGMKVDSALYRGTRITVSRPSPSRVRLTLPEARRPGYADTAAVTLFYRGRPEDGLILRENLHGAWTAFADNWPNRARHWFPSVDHPADKAAVTFRIEVPAGWSTVANGARIASRPLPDGRRLQVWREPAAIPVYTMVIGAGRFVRSRVGVARGGGRELPVTAVLFPRDRGKAGPFRRAPSMVETFRRLVGPFPYRKLALVQSATRYGGMENAGAIFFSEEDVSGGSLSETTVAHEVAHQWFGDAVTERRWTHLWLSEGFATYFAAVFHRAADGEGRFRRVMARYEETYLGSPATGRPVLRERPGDLTELLDANNYQKGAWVLHMLRRTVGDTAFFDGLRRYYLRFRGRTALTRDLRRAVEDASGLPLRWFFDQWLRRPGHPRLTGTWSWEGSSGRLRVLLRQEQRWEPFRLPVRIDVRTADGRRLRKRVWLEERRTEVAFPLDGRPSGVRLDPRNDLLGPARISRR